jgi:hypothetical protein
MRVKTMNVDKKIVKLYRTETDEKEDPASLSKAEAISFVDELTQEVFSLSGNYDVESRLQRHIVKIIRK